MDAEDVDGAAAAEGDGEREAADRDQQHVERAPQTGDARHRNVDRPFEADELEEQHDAGHEQAEHAVVGVGTRRPGDDGAEAEGVAQLTGVAEAPQQHDEDRQRRGRDQAEMTVAARDEHRRQGEHHAGDQGLWFGRRLFAREQVSGVPREGDVEEEDEVERRDEPHQRNQRPGQDVGHRRVVVQAEIGGRGVGRTGEDRRRVERQTALLELVLENPHVPDVDAGVPGRRPGEGVVEMTRQRPRRDDRDEQEPHEDGGVPPHPTGHMAELKGPAS